ncbi:MAG: YcgJ family protein [Synechococcaceae cyanobacterium]|nr:YcgJ family protein [Synechococcaceae cyanobacterium]
MSSALEVHSQQGVYSPRQGVVCDSVGRTCYDSYGPSIGITAEIFGSQAGNALSQQLSQSSDGGRDFRLSSGQACSVAKRTCWDDGWSAQNVAFGLTQQLFGRSGGGGQSGQAQVARDTGLCSLSRRGERVFDGRCRLKQVRQNGQDRYEIKLGNGTKYIFEQAGRQFLIRDGLGGSWPATFVDHGNTGIFRFGDYKLIATQENSNRTTGSSEAAGSAAGGAVDNLLNALFGK